ncbi:hypothetical protein F5Y17DRAFT_8094 [Xylariaceae sp. FL0594]|nr:hypothetical protein F5Y17DRAFT_8094 [Xylariaceae sp. FL0594]
MYRYVGRVAGSFGMCAHSENYLRLRYMLVCLTICFWRHRLRFRFSANDVSNCLPNINSPDVPCMEKVAGTGHYIYCIYVCMCMLGLFQFCTSFSFGTEYGTKMIWNERKLRGT